MAEWLLSLMVRQSIGNKCLMFFVRLAMQGNLFANLME